MASETSRRPETDMIHAGEPRPRFGGAVVMPIFQSANFETVEGEAYHDISYIRLSNTPNHTALAEKLRALEGSEAALVCASGMAAITTSLLANLCPGGAPTHWQVSLWGDAWVRVRAAREIWGDYQRH